MQQKQNYEQDASASNPKVLLQRQRVVVKFQDYAELPYNDGAETFFEEAEPEGWKRLLDEFPRIKLQRLYTALRPEEIRALMERAVKLEPRYRPPNLLTYFAVDCPLGTNAEELVRALSSWQIVQTAYVEGGPTPPPLVNPADDPRSASQGYLNAAPDGINARYAWLFAGGDGTGIRFIDLERGWTLNHEDLTAAGITLLSGVSTDYFGHGTSVLGELTAVDNILGDVGIVPHVSARVVSQWRPTYNTSDAILSAIGALGFGDVLLLEAQTNFSGFSNLPVEVESAVFDSIRLAVALGIVVVEAGGNGGNNLDTFAPTSGPFSGKQVLNRASIDFQDSGAIIVGAASSAAPHTRLGFSNYGSRVDCFGWGENIDTTGDGGTGNLTNTYTGMFGGTSGASPIVTGAAIAVQGMAQANLGFRFSPGELRSILSNAVNGTASSNSADQIGVMPNLRAIIDNVLNVAPDVYIRDFVGDVGDPHTGLVSASPDIILRQAAVANPQASFGEGSGTENSVTLGDEAEAGQDNFIYVRVRNRGGSSATNVSATVYWSPVATLVTPNLWTLVGTISILDVFNGNVLTVADAITWPSAAIPATGHYCFVGLIGNDNDPAPVPADFTDWDKFIRFIRENNNVTWRNFNVVNNQPPAVSDPPNYIALPFLVPGALDKARPMRLEAVARLPQGAQLLLELPLHLLDGFQARNVVEKIDRKRGVAWLRFNPYGQNVLGEALLPAKSVSNLRFLVQIPKERRENAYELYIRQLYEELEVGRVTWRLTPKARKEEMCLKNY